MELSKDHFRNCLLYEFNKGSNAAAACRGIRAVYGEGCVDESTCRRWFRKFRSGDTSLEDQPRSGRPSEIRDDDLVAIIEADPHLTTAEIAEKLEVHRTTVDRKIHALGYTFKLDIWVPHELSQKNLEDRMSACVSLLARQNNEPFLDRLVTGDEKWVLYKNAKRKRSICKKGQTPASTSKAELHPKKVMLSVWWDIRGIVYWELLQPNQTIDAEYYCQQLERLRTNLKDNRPALTNRKGIIFHHDNARPHTDMQTQQKLSEFGWEVLILPPYSPDLAPSDFHLFRSLQNHLTGKEFENIEEVRNGIQEFFDSKNREFYGRGIEMLPDRWQQVITNNGMYITD